MNIKPAYMELSINWSVTGVYGVKCQPLTMDAILVVVNYNFVWSRGWGLNFLKKLTDWWWYSVWLDSKQTLNYWWDVAWNFGYNQPSFTNKQSNIVCIQQYFGAFFGKCLVPTHFWTSYTVNRWWKSLADNQTRKQTETKPVAGKLSKQVIIHHLSKSFLNM